MTLRIFPYGNAQEKQQADGSWVFTCQHGVGECEGNMYQACAIEHYPTLLAGDIPTWWPFFLCLEKAASPTAAQECAKTGNLDWDVIDKCASSTPSKGSADDGNPLMHSIAVDTNNLQPPHQWTPWVVLNGKPLNQVELAEPLTRLVCNAYTGTDKPVACK